MYNKEKENAKRKYTREEIEKEIELDTLTCNGLDPNFPPDHGKYNIFLLYNYMKENNISVDELTQEILDKFLVDPK